MLLILDLDETLMHASQGLQGEPDFNMWDYQVKVRPHLQRFLEVAFEHFDVAVWSSSSADYAALAVEHLFPEPAKLKFLWARERCTYCWDAEVQDFVWAKRLYKVKRLGYGLERVLVIDDSPEKFRTAYGNLIRVSPFYGDPHDQELIRLACYLEKITNVQNVRKVEKRHWYSLVEPPPQI
ncbi:HAD family hydrolase [Deinococcus misasensis]|uniref:HAD family hydrolase n=1 Tax=Deinococcus misasensis TaxID=392413 RepID=UPI000558BB77|nr:HAD family hydrolase [Deinococcus misasensis]